jgi:hypothetical protein
MAARDAVKCVPEITRNHCPTSAKCAGWFTEAIFDGLETCPADMHFERTDDRSAQDPDEHLVDAPKGGMTDRQSCR